jgi:hypothetical protein
LLLESVKKALTTSAPLIVTDPRKRSRINKMIIIAARRINSNRDFTCGSGIIVDIILLSAFN